MNGVRKAERLIASIAWTLVAAVLFTGFLWVSAGWVGHTGQALGLWNASSIDLAEHVSRAVLGVAVLGLSRLYRKLDERENAGSVASWLSGWVLVLFSLGSLASLLVEGAAPVALLLVLSGWATVRLARYVAGLDCEEDDRCG